jgi:putative solute:sodium symporter small subunit
MSEVDDAETAPAPAAYWSGTLRLTAALLAVWFGVSFVLVYHARVLDFTLFGWPFGVWLASQGALIVYGLVIAGYALRMRRLDREHGVAETE